MTVCWRATAHLEWSLCLHLFLPNFPTGLRRFSESAAATSIFCAHDNVRIAAEIFFPHLIQRQFPHQLITTFGVSASSVFGSMSHKISWLRICIRPPIDVLNPPSSSESPNRRNKVWTSVPIFNRGSSSSSHPRKVASLFSKRARILSAAIFLSTARRQSGVLNTIEDSPDIPMLDDYGVTKPLCVFGEVFFDPGMSRRSEGKKQKQ